MKKLTLIFLGAVLIPSIVLAVLAWRTQREQEYMLERQRALVHQGTVEALAGEIDSYLMSQQAVFRDAVDQMLSEAPPDAVAGSFDGALRERWPLCEVGFVSRVDSAELLAPRAPETEDGREDDAAEEPDAEPRVTAFLHENSLFLTNQQPADVYARRGGLAPAPPADQGIAAAGEERLARAADEFNRFRRSKQSVDQASAFYKLEQVAPPATVPDEEPPADTQHFDAAAADGLNVEPLAEMESERDFLTAPAAPRPDAGAMTAGESLVQKLAEPASDSLETKTAEPAADTVPEALGAVRQNLSEPTSSPQSRVTAQPESQTEAEILSAIAPEDEYGAILDLKMQQSERALAQRARPLDRDQEGAPPAPEAAAAAPAPEAAAPEPGVPAEDLGFSAAPAPEPAGGEGDRLERRLAVEPDAATKLVVRNTAPLYPAAATARSASPQISGFNPERTDFGRLVGSSDQGALARFLDGDLSVMFWYRPAAHPGFVFGAQLDLVLLREVLSGVVNVVFESPDEICVALLDENGQPAARSLNGFVTDWARPVVSTEIGEVLPHWEVAAYFVNPGQITETARIERLKLALLVLAVLGAIAAGGAAIALDYRRQLVDARRKTDFVSNVSHELRTPLTSIHMFSDLLAAPAAIADEKRQRYADVIRSEAGRLTRLINNVLDFSRLERGERRFESVPLDLAEVASEVVDHLRPQLESERFRVTFEPGGGEAGAGVEGDRDALAQVLVNLVSNAEKYGGEAREITVEVGGGAGRVEVRVCDRGPGVPRGRERRIFERFYRAEDSLHSGVQGCGLGLTLARQIARRHGGDIEFRRRDGGGSCFVLWLPAAPAGQRGQRGQRGEGGA